MNDQLQEAMNQVINQVQLEFENRFYSEINNKDGEMTAVEMSKLIKDIADNLVSKLVDKNYPLDIANIVVIGGLGKSFTENLGKIPENLKSVWMEYLEEMIGENK